MRHKRLASCRHFFLPLLFLTYFFHSFLHSFLTHCLCFSMGPSWASVPSVCQLTLQCYQLCHRANPTPLALVLSHSFAPSLLLLYSFSNKFSEKCHQCGCWAQVCPAMRLLELAGTSWNWLCLLTGASQGCCCSSQLPASGHLKLIHLGIGYNSGIHIAYKHAFNSI